MSKKQILAICGSTRTNSVNELIIRWFTNRYGSLFNVSLYNNIASLPHFNSGMTDSRTPEEVKKLYELIEKADGILICTPEYIFSLPGSLKNVFEWMVSTTLFSDKPLAMIVASSAGEKAFEELKLIVQTLGANVNGAELWIPGVKAKFDTQGNLMDESLLPPFDQLADFLVDSIRNSNIQ